MPRQASSISDKLFELVRSSGSDWLPSLWQGAAL